MISELNKHKLEMEGIVDKAFMYKDHVDSISKEIGECELPVNINARGNELENLGERLTIISDELSDLMQADKDFSGDQESEQKITTLIKAISSKLETCTEKL